MRIVALDYGQVRTGVAVSDPTGTLARPVTVVERVDGPEGFARLLEILLQEEPELVVVGLPVSLDGREHAQAKRARAFARRLEGGAPYPVTLYDERFTTTVATRRGGTAPLDARGAAVILEDYLRSHGAA
jgi:putative holliday junction resolvase